MCSLFRQTKIFCILAIDDIAASQWAVAGQGNRCYPTALPLVTSYQATLHTPLIMRAKTPNNALSFLYPANLSTLSVAWDVLQIPSPPADYLPTSEDIEATESRRRYQGKIMQEVRFADSANTHTHRLAFIDKISPHAIFDFMCAEIGNPTKAGIGDLSASSSAYLWNSVYNFVHFVSLATIQEQYGLQNGQLHLACNYDPHTLDRESCQAHKDFHLHYIYWTGSELHKLQQATPFHHIKNPFVQRRFLDPLTFLGGCIIAEVLQSHASALPFTVELPSPNRSIAQAYPIGCVIPLPGWQTIQTPEFPKLINTIHCTLLSAFDTLFFAFTGHQHPPPPWHRHPLLDCKKIQANLQAIDFLSPKSRQQLVRLAQSLHSLSPEFIARLRHKPQTRVHHLSLNGPCYTLNLYCPKRNTPGSPLSAGEEVYLILQTRLFSDLGGAGLVCLEGVPRVRLQRGKQHYSEQAWRTRTHFQRAFLDYNQQHSPAQLAAYPEKIKHFIDAKQGWL